MRRTISDRRDRVERKRGNDLKKETKRALREITKRIESELPQKAKPLVRDLGVLVTKAWDEGQAEKKRVESKLAEIKALDDAEVHRIATAKSEAFTDEYCKGVEDRFETALMESIKDICADPTWLKNAWKPNRKPRLASWKNGSNPSRNRFFS